MEPSSGWCSTLDVGMEARSKDVKDVALHNHFQYNLTVARKTPKLSPQFYITNFFIAILQSSVTAYIFKQKEMHDG